MGRHGFHLARSECSVNHYYSYDGSDLVDSLERWCGKLRGLYCIEIKLEFASGTVSYVPDHRFSAPPLRWHTPLIADIQMVLHAYTYYLGRPYSTVRLTRCTTQHSKSTTVW